MTNDEERLTKPFVSHVRRRRRIFRRFDDEPALDVTELDLVAILEPRRPLDRLAHHLRAVLAPQIFDEDVGRR